MMEMSMHESKQQSPSILDMMMCESKQQSQNLMDSQFHYDCHNNTSFFQVQSQQNDEPIDYEKLLEAMTQAQIIHNHDIDIIVKTLHSYPLTIPDIVNHSVRAKESCCFGKQDSILHTHLNLPKLQILKTTLTFWQVIPFLKLNLRMNMILNLNLVIQFYFLI